MCTACRYCVDDCPKQIAIPEYFKIYNDFKRFQGTRIQSNRQQYIRASEHHGKASECISCGKCEMHCPQKLSIRELLKAVAENLE